MREHLLNLFKLQRIDSEVLEFSRAADAIPDKIAEVESGLEVYRMELGTLNSEADELRAEQTQLEAQISEDNGKLQKWKRRQNDIRSPREFQALSREVEQGERQVRNFEERVLEIMTELEDRKKIINGKDADLRERESVANAKIRKLREAQAKLNEDAEKAKAGREELAGQLNSRLLKRYDQVAERRNGLAVVPVVRGTCAGCNVKLRPQIVVEMLKYRTVETCQMCKRILVHSELLEDEGLSA